MENLNIQEVIERQNKLMETLARYDEENNNLLNQLLYYLSQNGSSRVNTRNAIQRGNMPHVAVFTHHLTISTRIFRAFEGFEKFKAVRFYTTNFKNILAMKFEKRIDKQAAEITKVDSTETWQVNSTNVVNRVFGGVAYGKPTKFWNAESHPTEKNTVLLWPATLAFAIGEHKVTVENPINLVRPDSNTKIAVTRSRIRFNVPVMKLIGNEDYQYPFVVVSKLGDGVFKFDFSNEGEYEVTPYSTANGHYGYEICSIRLLETLGLGRCQKAEYAIVDAKPLSLTIKEMRDEEK